MGWGGIRSRYMPFKRQNNSQNRAESRKVAKKNHKLRAAGMHGRVSQAARPCAHHHVLPVVAPSWSGPDASRTLRFELLLDLEICLESSCLASFSTSLHLDWIQTTHFP